MQLDEELMNRNEQVLVRRGYELRCRYVVKGNIHCVEFRNYRRCRTLGFGAI